jgi:chalcone isomerase-like protein
MNQIAPLTVLLGVLVCATVGARTLAGVELPDSVVVDGTTLALNGVGLRAATALRIKAYVAGLYLEQPTSDPKVVIDSQQRKRVTMKFLRAIDRKSLTSNWADSLRKAGGTAMEPAITEFTSLIDDVAKGDTLSFTWRPGTGVEIAKNAAVRGTIAGDEFARALFSLWFGPEPGDPNLKQGMLGT